MPAQFLQVILNENWRTSVAEQRKITKDTYLFREGDHPDSMYIIRTGTLAVTKTKGNTEVVLVELKAGSIVGEMALFDQRPRSANVKALEEAEVIALPYESLTKQMDQLPIWVKAILKTMNENIREANKKIKTLQPATQDEERFPPHIINKYISILNLVGHRYGRREQDGSISFSSVLLRNYTIQIFQEATNKMQSVVNVLTETGHLTQEDRGDGTQRIFNKLPEELFSFVDWYNEWLFKQEKDRLAQLSDKETKILNAIIFFAEKLTPDHKGFRKVNLNTVQNESMKEFGEVIRIEDFNTLNEKKYLSEKIMDEQGVYIMVALDEITVPAKQWTLVNALKRKLK